MRTGISRASGAKADILYDPGDSIHLGCHHLRVLPTPGEWLLGVSAICTLGPAASLPSSFERHLHGACFSPFHFQCCFTLQGPQLLTKNSALQMLIDA